MKILYSIITLSNSFAAMAGAMILASLATEYTGEDIYAQSFTMGPYLLGLGIGSSWADKFSHDTQLKWLWRLELLSLLTIVFIPLIFLSSIFIFLHAMPFEVSLDSLSSLRFMLALAALLALLLGVLSGAQFPLILKRPHQISDEVLVMINYLGPLLALSVFILSELMSWPLWHQVSLVVFLQLLGLMALNFVIKQRRFFYLSLLLVFPLVAMNFAHSRVENLLMRSSYLATRSSLSSWEAWQQLVKFLDHYAQLERVKTPYQTIDLLIEPPDLKLSLPGNATVFLNRKPQFDLTTVDVYHQTMVEAALNLKTDIKSILILGAGDGLLLKEWQSRFFEELVMVELDQKMLEWSATHPIMKELNQGAITKKDPRVKILVDDAIHYLKNNRQKFDLVLIDFPFPNSVDLAKLYSHEFYALVSRALKPEGLLILDLPIIQEASGKLALEGQTILKTLASADFRNPLVFGPHASFVALSLDQRPLNFDYARMQNVSLKTKLNLVPILKEVDFSEGEVNSMLRPRVL